MLQFFHGISKKLLGVLLFCLLPGLFSLPVKAAQAPVLLQTTIYAYQNEEYNLQTDAVPAAGLIWSSSDTLVATVTDGIVRTKKPGYARITVSDAGDKALFSKCLIIVKPGQVTNVHNTKTKSRKLAVSWKETKNCSGYSIYYRQKGNKEYQPVKQTTGTSAVIKGLSPETGYDIRVAAYVETPDGRKDGTLSEKIRLFTAPEAKGRTKIIKVTKGRLSFYHGQRIRFFTVQWKKVKDANSYRVYTQVGNKKPKLIDTVKKPKTTLYAALGYSYKIYVVPCRTKHGITAKGKKSAPVTIDTVR